MNTNIGLNVCGIYIIRNYLRPMIYIGASVNIYKRLGSHKRDLMANVHTNAKMQKDWFAQDGKFFSCGVLKVCTFEELGAVEQYFIGAYDNNGLYNVNYQHKMTPNIEKLVDKIHKGVDILPETNCWLYKPFRPRKYGRIEYMGKEYSTHRIMYEFYRENPYGKLVEHQCDNTRCCNPYHMELGWHKTNR